MRSNVWHNFIWHPASHLQNFLETGGNPKNKGALSNSTPVIDLEIRAVFNLEVSALPSTTVPNLLDEGNK